MGIIEPYNKIATCSLQDLAMQQRVLELQLQMLQNEMKQVELLGSLAQTRDSILTSAASCEHKLAPASDQELDTAALQEAAAALASCEYYHGAISWRTSWQLLAAAPPGTFLVRRSESRTSRHPYAISFQRGEVAGGATSIRVCLERGRWSLDCEARVSPLLPSFSSLSELVAHYSCPLSTSSCLVKLGRGLPRPRPRQPAPAPAPQLETTAPVPPPSEP